MNPTDNQNPNISQAPGEPLQASPVPVNQALPAQENTYQPAQGPQATQVNPGLPLDDSPHVASQAQSQSFGQPVASQSPIQSTQQNTPQPVSQPLDTTSQNQFSPSITNPVQSVATPATTPQATNANYPQATPVNTNLVTEPPGQNITQNTTSPTANPNPITQGQPDVADGNNKSPLVTLAAQLTFGGKPDSGTPKTPTMKVIGIVIIVISILLSGGIVFATVHVQQARANLKEKYGTARTSNKADVEKAVKASGPDMQSLSEGNKLDVSKLFNQTLGAHKQDIKGELNKQINMSNGVSFAVTGVEKGWIPPGDEDYYKPSSGHEYIKFAVTVGYRGKTGSISFSSSTGLRLKNSAGGLQDAKYIPATVLSNDLETYSRLNPGDFKSGYVIFEIKENESPISLVYAGQYYDHDFQQQTIRASIEVK